jgi:hypothetical protein
MFVSLSTYNKLFLIMCQIWAYFMKVTWNICSDIDMLFNGIAIILCTIGATTNSTA